MLRKATALGLVGFLLSCASLPSAQRAEVEIQPGPSEAEALVNGITNAYELGYHYLRSIVDTKGRTVRHELFISTRVTDPDQTIVQAEGPKDTHHTPIPIETKWAGCPQGFCSWTLEWSVVLQDDLLRKNLDGFSVGASTNRDKDLKLEVTSGQIWRQLVAVDSIMVWGKEGKGR
jgi:hypothetical protein